MSGGQAKGAGVGAAVGAGLGLALIATGVGAPVGAGLLVGGLAAGGATYGTAAATRNDIMHGKRVLSALGSNISQPTQNLKPIPTIDDAAVKAARNNQLISLQQRSGRASTQLSGIQGTKTTFGS